MTRTLTAAVAILTLFAAGCAMAPKATRPAPAEEAPPSGTPQTTSSGSPQTTSPGSK